MHWLGQLKLLLWKNFQLKRRRPLSIVAEALTPLVLFVILAAVRKDYPPVDVAAESFNAVALPSAGPVALIQSLYCSGTDLDSTGSTPSVLDDVTGVIAAQNISLTRLVELVRGTIQDEEAINRTLNRLGVTDFNPVFEAIDLDLPPFLTDPSFVAGFNTTALENQTVIREGIRQICNFTQSQQFADLQGIIDGSDPRLITALDNITEATGINVTEIFLDPESFNLTTFLDDLASNDLVVNRTLPLLLEQLSASGVNVTQGQIDAVQDLVRSVQNGTVPLEALETALPLLLGVSPAEAVPLALALSALALESPEQALMDLEAILRAQNITGGDSRVDETLVLLEELQRLQVDLSQLQQLGDVFQEILALDSVQALQQTLTETDLSDPDAMAALLDTVICGSSGRASFGEANWNLRRRSADAEFTAGIAAGERRRRRREEEDASAPEIPPADASSGGGDDPAETLTALLSGAKIYYAPDTPLTRRVIKNANRTIEELATIEMLISCVAEQAGLELNLLQSISSNFTLDFWQGFPDEFSMVKASMGTDNLASVIGGIAFQDLGDDPELPEHVNVSIRLHPWKAPETDKVQPDVSVVDGGSPENQRYYLAGFVFLQDMIQRGIIDTMAGSHVAAPAVFAQQFPAPEHVEDKFSLGVGATMPLFMTLAWIYTVSMITKSVVYEKELRLKESMKMMGMSHSVHWVGWFLTSLFFVTIAVILLTMVLVFGKLFVFVDTGIVFVLLELFGISTICLAFLISVFFSRAKVASASAGIIYFGFYLPYIFFSINAETMSAGGKWGLSLFSTTAFGIGTNYLAKFESAGVRLRWADIAVGYGPCDNFNLANVMLMLVIDSLLYCVLVWYVENVSPGYGVPKPFHFPLHLSYWFPSCAGAAEDRYGAGDASVPEVADAGKCEPAPEGPKGIRIVNMSKVYNKGACAGARPVRAVSNLTFEMRKGAITSLLGHNGAGKTTTMSILTGLFTPTEGTCYINGHDVRTDIDRIRGSLGICPQYNVLFDELTVGEHLWLIGRLKNLSKDACESETVKYLRDIDLEDKRHVATKNLSGGMKRKLSVAMAFIGGNDVVILDEPTAGMDPAARRSTWDLLLKYREGRTILLSTHHLDEADLLSERIGIMAHGRLRCAGSPLFLKHAYAASYILTMAVNGENVQQAALQDCVTKHIGAARVADKTDCEISFSLPTADVGQFAALFTELEDRSAALGVTSFGVSATTLEEVFLKVADDAEEEKEVERDSEVFSDRLTPTASLNDSSEGSLLPSTMEPPAKKQSTWDVLKDRLLPGTLSESDKTRLAAHAPVGADGSYTGRVVTGLQLRWMRFGALFTKRGWSAMRDRRSVSSQLILPALFVGLGMIIATLFPAQENAQPLALTPDLFTSSCGDANTVVATPYYLNDTRDAARSLVDSFKSQSLATQEVVDVESMDGWGGNLTQYIMDNKLEWQRKGRRMVFEVEESNHPLVSLSAGIKQGTTAAGLVRAWYDNSHYHSMPVAVATVNNAILGTVVPGATMTVSNHPINRTAEAQTEQYLRSGTDLTVAINTILALSFVPAAFAVFMVYERASKAKHLQMVSGADIVTYWSANFTWDMLNYFVPAILCLVIFLAAGLPAYTGRNAPAVVALLVLYGWGITPIMYCASFLFSVPSTAYVSLICINLFLGMTTTLSTFILQLFNEPSLDSINAILRWVFLLLPNYCLGRGLMDLAANEYTAQFYEIQAQLTGEAGKEFKDPFSFDLIGRNLMFLFLEGAVFFVLAIVIDYRKTRQQRQASSRGAKEDRSDAGGKAEDEDVAAERLRVAGLVSGSKGQSGGDDVLVVNDLRKTYRSRGKTKKAVRGLSFGVPSGQCFGLLGVNGAGKTTTFKMLSGDVSVTSGEGWVSGYSILSQQQDVRQHMGYCPQFDALNDLLTGREHLVMYSKLRGIHPASIPGVVEWMIRHMNLSRWADRVSKSYSGGNKRKLSVAIALLGNADLVFLDEPTSGMDPKARRFLWNLVTGVVRAGRCVILTSHAMDECQALCSRLGIMVNGQLQCIGSPQHLKTRFGDGYTLIAKIGGAPPDPEPLTKLMKERFPTASLEECHNGYVRYQIPSTHMPPLSSLFQFMEGAKGQVGLEDYSISQTSLDQIFCNFAAAQRDEHDPDEPEDEGAVALDVRTFANPVYDASSTPTEHAALPALENSAYGTSDARAARPVLQLRGMDDEHEVMV